jgi:ribosomal RNA-processing protein 9
MPPQKRQRAAAAAPGGGRGGRGGGGGGGGRGGGRPARDDNDDDDDDRVADSDEDEQAAARGGGGEEEEEEDEHAAESAADKRLRLAKAYLANLRTELAADKARKRSTLSDEEDEGEGDDDGDDDGDGGLAARLASDASQARGDRQRELASRVSVPRGAAGAAGAARPPPPAGVLWRGHKLPVTALALSDDDTTAWSASKDGALFRWDVETGARTRLPQPPPVPTKGVRGGARAHTRPSRHQNPQTDMRMHACRPPAPAPRLAPACRAQGPCAPPRSGAATVLALAVSSDGAMLASAGADKHVHVWDARTGAHLQAFPGHRDAVTCLSFRPGSRTLFSGSADRCVKIWSLDDMAYVDTLYGHANEILALCASRRERALSCGRDRTCRVWKVSEDSQLVFNAAALAGSLESAAWVGANEWVTGATDGSLARWAAMKKKPAGVWHAAHGEEALGVPPTDADSGVARKAGGWGLGGGAGGAAVAAARAAAGAPPPPGLGAAAGWVGAVASARGSDLVASGAGDGAVRLWRVGAGAFGFEARGALPARGFVNALAVARSGRFVLAGMGQEPRLGRWARDAGARNGVLMHALHVADEGEEL